MHRRKFTALAGISAVTLFAGCQGNSEDNDGNQNNGGGSSRELVVLEQNDIPGSGWAVETYSEFDEEVSGPKGRRFSWSDEYVEEGVKKEEASVGIDSDVGTIPDDSDLNSAAESFERFRDSVQSESKVRELDIGDEGLAMYSEENEGSDRNMAYAQIRDGETTGIVRIVSFKYIRNGESFESISQPPIEVSLNQVEKLANMMYE